MHFAEQVAEMYVRIVIGLLGVVQDSRAISMEVVLRAIFEVCSDGVNAAGELPCFEHLRLVHFATSTIGDLLAFFRYRDSHCEFFFLFNCGTLGRSSRGH